MHYLVGFIRVNDENKVRLTVLNSDGEPTDEITDEDSFEVSGVLTTTDKGQIVYIDQVDSHKSGSGKGDAKNKDK